MRAARIQFVLLAAALAAVACISAGCAGRSFAGVGPKPEHVPENFRQETAWLPREVRRVAVLPLTATHDELLTETQRLQLDQQLSDAVGKTELFEVVRVTSDQLRRWTGRARWGIEESLPPDFFGALRMRLGCDAVVFAKLTTYRPYPPLALGWKMHLVSATEPGIWWASDVVFDAGDEGVANSAIRYHREHQTADRSGARPETVLRSPGRFGAYTLAASLETLQEHQRNN